MVPPRFDGKGAPIDAQKRYGSINGGLGGIGGIGGIALTGMLCPDEVSSQRTSAREFVGMS